MALCEKILLAGFSGVGKTTFLKEIAQNAPVDWTQFDDLDQLILKKRGKKHKDLASLIEEVGWEKFRLMERQELEEWLKEDGKGVLALGGGAVSPLILELYGKSRKVKFCHLFARFETCWERLHKGEEIRPLVLRGKTELEKIYREREAIYAQIEWRIENERNSDLGDLTRAFWLQTKGAGDTIL